MGLGAPDFMVIGLDPESHAPVSHHAFKVTAQILAAGVMSARDVLGVVLAELKAQEEGRPPDAIVASINASSAASRLPA